MQVINKKLRHSTAARKFLADVFCLVTAADGCLAGDDSILLALICMISLCWPLAALLAYMAGLSHCTSGCRHLFLSVLHRYPTLVA